MIGHLVDLNGNFLCVDEFRRTFPAVTRTHVLMSDGVVKAILEYQKSKNMLSMDHVKRFDTKV